MSKHPTLSIVKLSRFQIMDTVELGTYIRPSVDYVNTLHPYSLRADSYPEEAVTYKEVIDEETDEISYEIDTINEDMLNGYLITIPYLTLTPTMYCIVCDSGDMFYPVATSHSKKHLLEYMKSLDASSVAFRMKLMVRSEKFCHLQYSTLEELISSYSKDPDEQADEYDIVQDFKASWKCRPMNRKENDIEEDNI